MIPYRAVCFDFDYTLGDATDSIIAGFHHAFTTMGLPVPGREAVRGTVGYILEDGYTQLSGDGTPEGRARFRALYAEVAQPIQMEGIPLCPGAAELLRGLKAAGVKMAIVSSRRSPTIQRTMERAGLLDTLALIIGSTDVKRHKPDPEGLLTAMDRLAVSPGETLFCGDTVMDAGAAQNAGCSFAAVLNGATRAEAFSACAHAYIARDLPDLTRWLGL